MADQYSECRLKMTKNSFFPTLTLNIEKTSSQIILKFGTVLVNMYTYHHAKFQVNRCNFVDARAKTSIFRIEKALFPATPLSAMSVVVIGSSKLSPLRVGEINSYKMRGQV